MRSRGLLLTTIAVALATTTATALAQSRAADLGKREFEAKCAVCHGKDGSGVGPYAENLKHPLPDLRTMAKRNGGVFPVKATFEMIEGAGKGHGPRDMPVWASTTPRRRRSSTPTCRTTRRPTYARASTR